jgi:hypothetical protein
MTGAPGRIRTSNLRFRRPMLYPIELRVLGRARSYHHSPICLSGSADGVQKKAAVGPKKVQGSHPNRDRIATLGAHRRNGPLKITRHKRELGRDLARAGPLGTNSAYLGSAARVASFFPGPASPGPAFLRISSPTSLRRTSCRSLRRHSSRFFLTLSDLSWLLFRERFRRASRYERPQRSPGYGLGREIGELSPDWAELVPLFFAAGRLC